MRSATIVLALVVLAAPAAAQRADQQVPEELRGLDIVEHKGDMVPLDTVLKDEQGREVKLREYFDGEHPVIFTIVYFNCPMLCTLVLNGLVDGLGDIEWTPGQEFRIVTLSFNAAETHRLARMKKQNYIKDLGKPQAAGGWHFLTGKESAVKTVCDTFGFKYRWNPDTREFMHQAAIFVCAPDGKITQYFYGTRFEGPELKWALMEAADGKIGSATERFFFACGHLLDETNPGLILMKLGGILTVLVLIVFLGILWLRGRKKAAGVPADALVGG